MPERRRSVMWPVLLIVVGIVLLLVQTGVISVAWTDLWRFWPVLLILIGLDILLGGVKHGWIIFIVLAAVLVVGAAIYVVPGTVQGVALKTEHLTYPAAGIKTASVRLEVGAAELNVETMSDSANLLEADISYNQRLTVLNANMDNPDGQATLRISTQTQGTTFGMAGNNAEEWDVRLNTDIPTSLVLNAGVSDAELDLSDATLTALDINAGVGDVRVALPEQGAYSVNVNGGVGSLTLEVPEGVEARVRVDGGLGSVDVDSRFEQQGKAYVTAGYAEAESRVEIDIDGGVGSIKVK